MSRPPRRRSWMRVGLWSAAACFACTAAPAVRAEDPKPAPKPAPKAARGEKFLEAVDQGIVEGIAWLRRAQARDGGFGLVAPDRPYDPTFKGTLKDYPTGSPALGAYTLMKCGVPPDDPIVKKALGALAAAKIFPSSYELSMAILAWTATTDPAKQGADSAVTGEKRRLKGEARKRVQDLVDRLVKRRAPVAWRYNWDDVMPTKGGEQDLSSTQLAALALLSAEHAGVSVESKVWNDLAGFAFAQQEPNGPPRARAIHPRVRSARAPGAAPYAPAAGGGAETDRARGFAYIFSTALHPDEGLPTGGMTACGIGTIATARYVLERRSDRTWLKRDPAFIDQSIRDAGAWLDLNWSAFDNPKKTDLNIYHVYYLYCVERAMDLIGASRIGRHDWFVEMGTALLDRQKADGSWETGTTHKPYAFLDTCFALLFLQRATRGGIPFPEATSDDAPTPAPRPTPK